MDLLLRHLTVKYKKLDLKNEFFNKKSFMKRKNKKFQKKGSNSLNKLSLFQKMMVGFQKNVLYQCKNAPSD